MFPKRRVANQLESFIPAKWRGTTAVSGQDIGLSLDIETGEIARMLLSVDSAMNLAESIIEQVNDYRTRTTSQSCNSSGRLNDDGSPQEGQSE